MSFVSETIAQRITLEDIATRYGFLLDPSFCGEVTVASIATDMDSIQPGCLFVPGERIEIANISHAAANGAYAIVLPRSMRPSIHDAPVPVLYGEPTPAQLGMLASQIAGAPSQTLAVFSVYGEDSAFAQRTVVVLAQFLHMLGNPVGTICQSDSTSLERFLDMSYPIDVLTCERVLSVCLEDGAAAVIIALDEQTLQANSLQSIAMDVLGVETERVTHEYEDIAHMCETQYGFELGKTSRVVTRNEESDMLARQSGYMPGSERELSLAIAMVLAAGVKKSSIKSSLRMSKELR